MKTITVYLIYVCILSVVTSLPIVVNLVKFQQRLTSSLSLENLINNFKFLISFNIYTYMYVCTYICIWYFSIFMTLTFSWRKKQLAKNYQISDSTKIRNPKYVLFVFYDDYDGGFLEPTPKKYLG